MNKIKGGVMPPNILIPNQKYITITKSIVIKYYKIFINWTCNDTLVCYNIKQEQMFAKQR